MRLGDIQSSVGRRFCDEDTDFKNQKRRQCEPSFSYDNRYRWTKAAAFSRLWIPQSSPLPVWSADQQHEHYLSLSEVPTLRLHLIPTQSESSFQQEPGCFICISQTEKHQSGSPPVLPSLFLLFSLVA